jgi:hypothetical protein
MCQEQCIQLNEEATKWKEQVDISKKIFRVSGYYFCFISYNNGKWQSKQKAASVCIVFDFITFILHL